MVIDIVKMDINKGVTDDKFVLDQPEGTTLQTIGAAALAPPHPRLATKVTGKLVLENLKHRPMRSLLSILLIGVPVTLILCLVGLSHGMLEDSQRRARGIGADIIVRPPGTSLLTLSGAPSAENLAKHFEQQPHVTHGHRASSIIRSRRRLRATGIDLDQFNRMSGGFTYLRGRTLQRPRRGAHRPVLCGPERAFTPASTINLLQSRLARRRRSSQAANWRASLFPLEVLQDLTSQQRQTEPDLPEAGRSGATLPAVVDILKKRESGLPDLLHGGVHLAVQREQYRRACASSSA